MTNPEQVPQVHMRCNTPERLSLKRWGIAYARRHDMDLTQLIFRLLRQEKRREQRRKERG